MIYYVTQSARGSWTQSRHSCTGSKLIGHLRSPEVTPVLLDVAYRHANLRHEPLTFWHESLTFDVLDRHTGIDVTLALTNRRKYAVFLRVSFCNRLVSSLLTSYTSHPVRDRSSRATARPPSSCAMAVDRKFTDPLLSPVRLVTYRASRAFPSHPLSGVGSGGRAVERRTVNRGDGGQSNLPPSSGTRHLDRLCIHTPYTYACVSVSAIRLS